MSATSVPSSPTTNSNGQSKPNELADPAVIPKDLDWLELLPDAVLVRQAQAGNSEALDLLLRRHRNILLSHARRHCGDCSLVEDLCQETCLSFVSHLSGLRAPEAFTGWLQTSLANATRHCRRKNCKKSGTPRREDGPCHIEGLSVAAAGGADADWQCLWNVLWEQTGGMDGRLRRAAAIMLEYYAQHEAFPAVRLLAEATHSSHGAAERRRHAVLCAWQRALTVLDIHP